MENDEETGYEIRMPGFVSTPPDLSAGPPLSQEQLDWSEEAQRVQRMQKRYWISACLLLLFSAIYIVVSVASNTVAVPGVWMLSLVFSIALLVVGDIKRNSRVRNLRPPPGVKGGK